MIGLPNSLNHGYVAKIFFLFFQYTDANTRHMNSHPTEVKKPPDQASQRKVSGIDEGVVMNEIFFLPNDARRFGEFEENNEDSILHNLTLEERIKYHLLVLISVVGYLHEKQVTNEQGKKQITRLILTEFSLYPFGRPLTLAEFTKLNEGLKIIAKQFPDTIYLTLASVAVEESKSSMTNRVINVKCGESPEVTSFPKTIQSDRDPSYSYKIQLPNSKVASTRSPASATSVVKIKPISRLSQYYEKILLGSIELEPILSDNVDRLTTSRLRAGGSLFDIIEYLKQTSLAKNDLEFIWAAILKVSTEEKKRQLTSTTSTTLKSLDTLTILKTMIDRELKKDLDEQAIEKIKSMMVDYVLLTATIVAKKIGETLQAANCNYNNIITYQLAENLKIIFLIEVCIDHAYGIGKMNLINFIQNGLFPTGLLSHVATGNVLPIDPAHFVSLPFVVNNPIQTNLVHGVYPTRLVSKDQPKFVKPAIDINEIKKYTSTKFNACGIEIRKDLPFLDKIFSSLSLVDKDEFSLVIDKPLFGGPLHLCCNKPYELNYQANFITDFCLHSVQVTLMCAREMIGSQEAKDLFNNILEGQDLISLKNNKKIRVENICEFVEKINIELDKLIIQLDRQQEKPEKDLKLLKEVIVTLNSKINIPPDLLLANITNAIQDPAIRNTIIEYVYPSSLIEFYKAPFVHSLSNTLTSSPVSPPILGSSSSSLDAPTTRQPRTLN